MLLGNTSQRSKNKNGVLFSSSPPSTPQSQKNTLCSPHTRTGTESNPFLHRVVDYSCPYRRLQRTNPILETFISPLTVSTTLQGRRVTSQTCKERLQGRHLDRVGLGPTRRRPSRPHDWPSVRPWLSCSTVDPRPDRGVCRSRRRTLDSSLPLTPSHRRYHLRRGGAGEPRTRTTWTTRSTEQIRQVVFSSNSRVRRQTQ